MDALRLNSRRLLLAIALLITTASHATADQTGKPNSADPRLERVEQWLKTVMHHQPGEADEPANLVALWSNGDIRTLWVDANVVVQLMRNPRGLAFNVQFEGQKTVQRVRYTAAQMHRLKVLACAAAGAVSLPACVDQRAGAELDEDLVRLSSLAAASRLGGDHDNYILRRGALLHADIAMLVPARSREPVDAGLSAGPQRIRLDISDGQGVDLTQDAIQWEFGRMLLDYVKPPHTELVAPARDEMVRQWYRATAAWMQQRGNHDTFHLDRARALFPTDADILFLSGCQHETYASPAMQSAVRSLVLPTGFVLDVTSDRNELRAAEGFFRRALVVRPDFGEAHLRLGRVLLMQGRAPEASIELQQAIASFEGSEDDQLLYYAELFAGAAHEAMSQLDAARASYEKAAELYPAAQSPRLALSALARRRGDRAAALRALQEVFELPPSGDPALDEPWWRYDVSQARNADALLGELRKPFREGAE